MKHFTADKGLWLVALSATLTLSSVSLLFCPTAHAGQPGLPTPVPAAHTPTEGSKTAMSIDPDDDGDELLEHWGTPKYWHEERVQTGGIIAALAVAGVAGACRRQARRRTYGHG